jgi:NAD(P)-dependent dehydrogenase (short-subunit alcohol dehydrogenase family)
MSTNWTTSDIPDLTGKIIIVTGANSGIGWISTKEFARNGAQVIMACRNANKATAAADAIQAEIPNAKLDIMALDLSSLASIRSFAVNFQEKYDTLDILLNNAGIMMVPYGTTEDGFERQQGTNHFGHFALTGLLLPTILKTPGARVVNVSSNGHKMGKMDFDNLMYEGGKGYSPTKAYMRSKLENLLFTYELQRRFTQHGINAQALAAHPGGSDTNLATHLLNSWFMKAVKAVVYPLFVQSAEMGALPNIRASVDPSLQGGQYVGPKGFQELKGYPVVVPSNKASHNLEDAKQLWDISEQLTGVSYSWPST